MNIEDMNIRMKVILLLALIVVPVCLHAERKVVVSKQRFVLCVVDGNDTIFKCPVGVGKNYGNKRSHGDFKTPEGTFKISMIQNSQHWTHDFHDGKGRRKGAYGPWFIRLKVPGFSSIGIHGTCFPQSIGTRCSEGCIRLLNNDIARLKRLIRVNMKCIIEAD